MNWDRIEGNWKRIKGNVAEQWDNLSEDQLVSRIQESYDLRDNEAEHDLTDWQERLSEIARARETALGSERNTRFMSGNVRNEPGGRRNLTP